MNDREGFFLGNLVAVFFVYGLSFLVMCAVILWRRKESARFEMTEAFLLLANFGLWHGLTEWTDMLRLVVTSPPDVVHSLAVLKLALLAVSFLYLLLFGLYLATASRPEMRLSFLVLGSPVVLLVYGVTLHFALQDLLLGEVAVRALVGLPGAALAGVGFLRLAQTLKKLGMARPSGDALVVAASFGSYAILTGLVFRTDGLPVLILGMPVQILRAACALVITAFVVRILAFFSR